MGWNNNSIFESSRSKPSFPQSQRVQHTGQIEDNIEINIQASAEPYLGVNTIADDSFNIERMSDNSIFNDSHIQWKKSGIYDYYIS